MTSFFCLCGQFIPSKIGSIPKEKNLLLGLMRWKAKMKIKEFLKVNEYT